MVHQVRRRLVHAPRVARRAPPAPLAGEGDQIVVRAALTPHPRKTVGKDAALQVFAKRLFDIGRWCVVVPLSIELPSASRRKPCLQMTGHGAVQHAALGVAWAEIQGSHALCLIPARFAAIALAPLTVRAHQDHAVAMHARQCSSALELPTKHWHSP